jgi:hypothetical protein
MIVPERCEGACAEDEDAQFAVTGKDPVLLRRDPVGTGEELQDP